MAILALLLGTTRLPRVLHVASLPLALPLPALLFQAPRNLCGCLRRRDRQRLVSPGFGEGTFPGVPFPLLGDIGQVMTAPTPKVPAT